MQMSKNFKQWVAIFILYLFSFYCSNIVFAMEFVRKKNTATLIYYPIMKTDGTRISGATGANAQYSQSFDTGTATTLATVGAPTEIGSSGLYYSSLSAAQMNADYIILNTTSTSTGAIPQCIVVRTTIADPHLNAATDDGGVINVTGGAVDTATALTNSVTVSSFTSAGQTDIQEALTNQGYTTTRAPYLDALNTGVTVSSFTSAGQTDMQEAMTNQGYTSTRGGYLDKVNSLTFTVAGKIDANVYTWNGTAVATPSTAGIPDINVLNWKNAAAQAMTGDAYAYILKVSTGVTHIDTGTPQTGDVYAIANNGTYGNSALNTAIGTRLATTGYTAPDNTNITNIYNIVNSGTYGNSALNTSINKISTTTAHIDTSIPQTGDSYAQFTSTWTVARANKLDNLDAAISSRGTSTLTTSDNIGINWADVDNPTTTLDLSNTSMTVSVSSTTVAQGVWNALKADYNTAATMGNAMNSAASAGDPWATELPGAYTGIQAGNLLNLINLKNNSTF